MTFFHGIDPLVGGVDGDARDLAERAGGRTRSVEGVAAVDDRFHHACRRGRRESHRRQRDSGYSQRPDARSPAHDVQISPRRSHRLGPLPVGAALFRRFRTTADRLQLRSGRGLNGVLTGRLHRGALGGAAEAFAVAQEALLATEQVELEAGHRHVGNRAEDRAQAAVDGTHLTGDDDVDLPLQVDRDVGQLPFGGAQVDRARQRLVENRGGRHRPAQHRAGRTSAVGEVGGDAGRADVRAVEQLALGQRDGDVAQVGFAWFGRQHRLDRRLTPPPDAARELQRELRFRRQDRAVRQLVVGAAHRLRAGVSSDLRRHRERVAVGRVEGEVGTVEIDTE